VNSVYYMLKDSRIDFFYDFFLWLSRFGNNYQISDNTYDTFYLPLKFGNSYQNSIEAKFVVDFIKIY